MSFFFSAPVPLKVELYTLSKKSIETRQNTLKNICPSVEIAVVELLKKSAFSDSDSMTANFSVKKLFYENVRVFGTSEIDCKIVYSDIGTAFIRSKSGAGPDTLFPTEVDYFGNKIVEFLTSHNIKASYTYGCVYANWEPEDEQNALEMSVLAESRIISDPTTDII